MPGKKKDKKKKGLALEKQQRKNDKKASKDLKRYYQEEEDEQDIDDILHDLQQEQELKRKTLEIIHNAAAPSPRSNSTLVAHPRKAELYLFAGEFFDGKRTSVYNDLYCYDITKKIWKLIIAPHAPAARSSHQAFVYERDGSVFMCVLYGEFTNPNNSQFYHFDDIYSINLDSYIWTKLDASSAGPSARSGMRCICHKNNNVVCFGGFSNKGTNNTTYYSDLYILNLNELKWNQVPQNQTSWPSPRSGCVLLLDEEKDQMYLYSGVSTLFAQSSANIPRSSASKTSKPMSTSKEMYKMIILSDIWRLDLTSFQFKNLKKKGLCPLPRFGISACSICVGNNRKGIMFAGVAEDVASNDNENDSENVQNFNDVFTFNFDDEAFHLLNVKGSVQSASQFFGVKKKDNKKEEVRDVEGSVDEDRSEKSIFDYDPTSPPTHEAHCVVSSSSATLSLNYDVISATSSTLEAAHNTPSARRSASVCIKGSQLFMCCGVTEHAEDRESYHSDLWLLDVSKDSKLSWQQLVEDTKDSYWIADSEDDEELRATSERTNDYHGSKEDDGASDEDSEPEDSEPEDRISESEAERKDDFLLPTVDESLNNYFERTLNYWLDSQQHNMSDKQARRAAFAAAQTRFNQLKSTC